MKFIWFYYKMIFLVKRQLTLYELGELVLGGLVVDSADSELKLMNFCSNKLNIYK